VTVLCQQQLLYFFLGESFVGNEHFGARLRELREAAGLSRQELADKAGMKIGGIRDLEQGLRRPLWDSVVALAEVLGVNLHAFLEEPACTTEPKRGRPRKDMDTSTTETSTTDTPPKPRGRTTRRKGIAPAGRTRKK
jgi:transcriptional regulator with XRE-family HTH domain